MNVNCVITILCPNQISYTVLVEMYQNSYFILFLYSEETSEHSSLKHSIVKCLLSINITDISFFLY